MKSTKEIISKLKSLKNPKNIEGMKRFAVGGKNTLGIPLPILRNLAKEINKSYKNNLQEKNTIAFELWDSEIHEARMIAAFIAVPDYATLDFIDKWVGDFDSWDICDQTCNSYLRKTKFSHELVERYVDSDREFVKRTAFVMMAVLAVHDKNMTDKDFDKFFVLIIKKSDDERNFVKKAVNWALRQIGKRNKNLQKKALKTSKEILKKHPGSRSARWTANDAIRELSDDKNIRNKL